MERSIGSGQEAGSLSGDLQSRHSRKKAFCRWCRPGDCVWSWLRPDLVPLVARTRRCIDDSVSALAEISSRRPGQSSARRRGSITSSENLHRPVGSANQKSSIRRRVNAREGRRAPGECGAIASTSVGGWPAIAPSPADSRLSVLDCSESRKPTSPRRLAQCAACGLSQQWW
jgi:hypothetical protein